MYVPKGSNVVLFGYDLFNLEDYDILPTKELHSSLGRL